MALVLIFAIIIWVAVSAVRTVRPNTVCIVERLGKYYQTWAPGVHICAPAMDRVVATVPTDVQQMDSMDQPVISLDNKTFHFRFHLNFQVTDPKLFHYSSDRGLVALELLVCKVIREVMGNLEATYILSNYEDVRKRIVFSLFDAAEQFGIGIIDFEYKIPYMEEDRYGN